MYKKRYASANIRGKLRVCRYLSAQRALKRHVPHTVSLTKSNLQRMAGFYRSLYIKPDVGSLGIGVHKLNRRTSGYELLSTRNRHQLRRNFGTLTGLYRHLKANRHGRLIVQRAIRLDSVNGRPYDLRAMVQRKRGGSWTCTGLMAKIGARNKIVTNYYQGGKIVMLPSLLKQKGFSAARRRASTAYLTERALKVARLLSSKRAGMHEMGIDFAYDRQGRLWILEVNSNHPQYHPLKKLDRKAYDRMAAYARGYGRYDNGR
ncbi:YheC/YheD family protein [Paenibacillus sp. MBLB4367]|uniref:YheC/YheD family protein n=1 Tax=Paenibacillus sp. MBLB4367 TaxID=3384767 RepID=UPI0039083021